MQRLQGKSKTMWFPKTASTAIPIGSAMIFDGSGAVTVATSSSTKLLGVTLKVVVSTDADYASNTSIPIEVPVENYCVWNAATTGATSANVGVAYDLTDAVTVNLSGTSHKVVTVVQVVSATSVNVIFNSTYGVFNGS